MTTIYCPRCKKAQPVNISRHVVTGWLYEAYKCVGCGLLLQSHYGPAERELHARYVRGVRRGWR